jgi:hypothetical protein
VHLHLHLHLHLHSSSDVHEAVSGTDSVLVRQCDNEVGRQWADRQWDSEEGGQWGC